MLVAFNHGAVKVEPVKLKNSPEWGGRELDHHLPGRVIFNSILPEGLRFVNRQLGKKDLGAILDRAYDMKVNRVAMVKMLDDIKMLGYRWATRSGISFGVQSIIIPPEKVELTKQAMEEDEELKSEYNMGISPRTNTSSRRKVSGRRSPGP